MIRFWFAILCLVAAVWVTDTRAAEGVYGIKDVPNPRAGGAGGYVSNPDGTLSAATVAEINNRLFELQKATSIEVAVVVLSSIGDMPPEDFGIRLLREWGVGKKDKDNGMLILLVTDDRIVRFEVGYGLEGVMTDALSKRIQTTRMMPYLKNSDWDGAMLQAVDAVNEYFTDPDSDLRNEAEWVDGEGKIGTWGIIMLVVVFILLSILGGRGGGGFLGGMLLGGLMGRGGGGSGGGGFGGFGGGSAGGGGATTRF